MASSRGVTDWVSPASKTGEFQRQTSVFRNWIVPAADVPAGADFVEAPAPDAGAAAPTQQPCLLFPAQGAGRYHLFVSYACPWAHRTLIARAHKRLDADIGVTAVHWHLGEAGWRFITPAEATSPECAPDPWLRPSPHHAADATTHLRDVYRADAPDYGGRCTVPVLWDSRARRIVSNESADIVRMLDSAFDAVPRARSDDDDGTETRPDPVPLYPPDRRAEMDDLEAWMYDRVNNGVYKAGFATTETAYRAAATALFDALDALEAMLRASAASAATASPSEAAPLTPFLVRGTTQPTSADVRLYTTLVRFDAVYVQHFKCNVRDVRAGYPALHRWLRALYWFGGDARRLGQRRQHGAGDRGGAPALPQNAFGATTRFDHIKKHYTRSHTQINPFAITPLGPVPDILPWDEEVPAVQAAVEAGGGAAAGRSEGQL